MRKKIFNFSTPDLPNSAYPLSLLLSFACAFLDWAHAQDAPGLPVARLTLPSLPADTEIVSSTGTYVGGKINEFNTLIRGTEGNVTLILQSTRELYENAISEVSQYHLTMSEIEAKLQLGTTPGNPLLIARYDAAHEKLNQITNIIGKMDGLAKEFRQTSDQMNTLSEHIKATLHIPGALDEDHAHLILMSETLSKVQSAITQTLEVLNANEKRQNDWLMGEKIRFSNLSLAIDKGKIITLPTLTSPYPVLETLPEIIPSTEKPIPLLPTKKEERAKPVVTPVMIGTAVEPTAITVLPLAQPPEEIRKELKAEQIEELPQVISEPLSLQKEPLPLVNIASRPDAQPIPEEEVLLSAEMSPEQNPPPQELMLFSAVLKNRAPLGVVDNQQDLQAQKWYIFSTANRGLNSPKSIVEIVNVIENNNPTTTRGEEVKDLLVEMGLNPSQLSVINAKSDNDQAGQVVLVGK